MRKNNKLQCLELLHSLEEAGRELVKLIEGRRIEEALPLLEDCQQAAIGIGNSIEDSEGEGTKAVHFLEEYCEAIYQLGEALTREEAVDGKSEEEKLSEMLEQTRNELRFVIPNRYEAVFLPYKVSMWDSLESIWKAMDADPDCDAYVVPIPYYDKNPDESFGQIHYEGDRYPEDVPVVSFADYDLEKRRPDFVFIHNPYDEYNNVTSVPPAYYSYNLKKHTDCLVYVPYYATAGNMAESQSLLSAYIHADYIVAQSEGICGFFDSQIPKEKFLPLGSPKFDKIIQICKNPPEQPAEWKEKLKGKRVYFFNTSIAGFLHDTERFLKKMYYVFECFQGREDACLIWRPHPLLESTMDSMRPKARPVYDELKRFFLEKNIGILDETPQIEPTIALCDVYLGDAGTSVTALFGVAGKAMFILNNHLLKVPEEDDWQAWVCQPLRSDRNNRYCITMGNRLFEDRDGDHHYRYLCELSEEYGGGGYYSRAVEASGKIVAFPANAEHILLIDPRTLEKRRIKLEHEVDRDGAFAGFFSFLVETPQIYWILPNRYPAMIRFDTETEELSYIRDEAFSDTYSVYTDTQGRRILAARWIFGTKKLSRGERKQEVIDCYEEEITIPGMRMKGRRIFCLNTDGSRLRAINLDTGEAEERKLDWDGLYTGIMRDRENMDVIWFLPNKGTVLGKWTLSQDKWEKVDAGIEGLRSIQRPQGIESEQFYFSNGIFVRDKLILSPKWGNKFVELDTKMHEAKEWKPPFSYTLEDKNDYWFNGSVGYFYRDPRTLESFYFYTPEHKNYRLDPELGTCSEIPVTFDKEEIASMAAGFHKDSQWMPYCCYEDVFNSLPEILSGRIHGPVFERERQIEAYRAVNASPEGDCGEKVRQILKSKLFSNMQEEELNMERMHKYIQ
ncbi:MAG: hypothetical protein K5697_17005 [Lachnospiraceae bacterium]|nr:hypothetical protein [Lachnospiraceae bacterium]